VHQTAASTTGSCATTGVRRRSSRTSGTRRTASVAVRLTRPEA
jgi:hypothetical protein